MNYEKAYKDALERAKVLMKRGYYLLMPEVFPELKENEDEQIKRKLIELFSDMEWDDSILHDYELDKNKTIAWLEKQGEQKKA